MAEENVYPFKEKAWGGDRLAENGERTKKAVATGG